MTLFSSGPAKESPDVIDRIVDYVIRFLRLFTADEQKKVYFSPYRDVYHLTPLAQRQQEFSMKVSALVRSALSDRVAEMIEIRSLATSPAKQGCGYGSALVNTVTARVFRISLSLRATYMI